MFNTRLRWLGLAGTLALGLAACSSSYSSGPSNPPALSQAQADSVAETLSADASDLIDASTFSAGTGVALSAAASLISTAGCVPAVSPASPTNSDADPVPDSVRFDFSGCSFTLGNYTFTADGMIDFLDPTPALTDFALESKFTDFTRTRTNDLLSRTVATKQNGTRLIAGNADSLLHTITNFTTDYTFADGSTARHVKDWDAKFKADIAGSIAHGLPLPDGNLTITGSSTWARGGAIWNLSLTTPAPLHRNAACAVAPRFDSGTAVAVVTRGGSTSTVAVQFTACGQYTVTRS
jgi:hypothetical protein